MRFPAHTRDPMGGTTTMPRSVFALRTSAFDDFLYAPIGEEENGMVLTALSALARLGVDPWDEAARLSELPQEAATKRLTTMISGLPHGRWAAPAAGDIAARLTILLSGKHVAVTPSPATADSNHRPSPAMTVTWLCFFLVSVLAFLVLRYDATPSAMNQNAAVVSTETSPQTPLP